MANQRPYTDDNEYVITVTHDAILFLVPLFNMDILQGIKLRNNLTT